MWDLTKSKPLSTIVTKPTTIVTKPTTIVTTNRDETMIRVTSQIRGSSIRGSPSS